MKLLTNNEQYKESGRIGHPLMLLMSVPILLAVGIDYLERNYDRITNDPVYIEQRIVANYKIMKEVHQSIDKVVGSGMPFPIR